MEQYTVTGMSCAACQARVEKAVSKVPGVTSCAVSLLTNSMGVEGDADQQAVIQAVEDAGYGAMPRGREPQKQGGSSAAQSASSASVTRRSMSSRPFSLFLPTAVTPTAPINR